MKELQKLLEKKAEDKLKKDADIYCKLIQDDFLFSAISTLKITKDSGKEVSLATFFWGHDSDAIKVITHNKLPSYIEAETKAFVKKVDQLSTDINELKNI